MSEGWVAGDRRTARVLACVSGGFLLLMLAGYAFFFLAGQVQLGARVGFVAAGLLLGVVSALAYGLAPSRPRAAWLAFAMGLNGVTGVAGLFSIGIPVIVAVGAGLIGLLHQPRAGRLLLLVPAGVAASILGYYLTHYPGEFGLP